MWVGWGGGGGIITSYSCVSQGGGENARFHFADEREIHIWFVRGHIFTLVIWQIICAARARALRTRCLLSSNCCIFSGCISTPHAEWSEGSKSKYLNDCPHPPPVDTKGFPRLSLGGKASVALRRSGIYRAVWHAQWRQAFAQTFYRVRHME